MKDVTIDDIARLAQVSKSTVSRVLNGTAAVHPDKRRAVLEATQRVGFQPNIVARSLAKGRSMTIGVLTQLIGSPFYDTVSQGIISGLGDSGYSPVFVDGQWQRSQELEAIRALLRRRVDGLVLIGGDLPGDEISKLCGSLPTVVVGRDLPDQQCVTMDNIAGGYDATRHLIQRGHRRIAMIRGAEQHVDARDRLAGYRRALAESGIAEDRDLVLPGDFSADSGSVAIEQLIETGIEFSAVFAANDIMAFGARLALYRRGMRVPADVSIVGFDDQMESAYMTPPLTTVRQPAREMGQAASRGVLALISGQTFQTMTFTGQLQVRDSVAPA